jgi:hypothetical protein
MRLNTRFIILSLLVLLMVFVFASSFKKLNTRKGRIKEESQSSTLAQKKTKESDLNINKSIKKRNTSQFKNWGRNPFTLAKGVTSLAGLNLMGILWDKDFPQAIINDKIVVVGDVVDGNKVIEIQRDHVIVSDGANNTQLRLWSGKE